MIRSSLLGPCFGRGSYLGVPPKWDPQLSRLRVPIDGTSIGGFWGTPKMGSIPRKRYLKTLKYPLREIMA